MECSPGETAFWPVGGLPEIPPMSSEAGAKSKTPVSTSLARDPEETGYGSEPDYILPADTKVTTLTLRNIPSSLTSEEMVALINAHGFGGTYDLLYMAAPRKRTRKSSLQYIFVNFKTEPDATAFSDVFKNYRFPGSEGTRLAYAMPAKVQGFDANYNLRQNSDSSGVLLTFP